MKIVDDAATFPPAVVTVVAPTAVLAANVTVVVSFTTPIKLLKLASGKRDQLLRCYIGLVKTCGICNIDKNADDFYGRGRRCKSCVRDAMKAKERGELPIPMPRLRNAPPGMKRCTACNEIKAADAFYKKQGRCIPCFKSIYRERYRANPEAGRQRTRQWAAANPEKVRERTRRYAQTEAKKAYDKAWYQRFISQYPDKSQQNKRNATLRAHGLTGESWDAMLASQDGGCAICGAKESTGRSKALHIDHDHACCPGSTNCPQCVRGLLCYDCNNGLAKFHDNPDLLLAAAAYLSSWISRART